jgi:hypothetical protein
MGRLTILAALLLLAACGPDDAPPRWEEVCVESHMLIVPRFIRVGNSTIYSPLYPTDTPTPSPIAAPVSHSPITVARLPFASRQPIA